MGKCTFYQDFTMQSRSLLQLGSRTVQHMQRRGKAVQNYKRPSMDEYPVPFESWVVANARTQNKYNMILAFGLATFVPTMVYCWYSDKTVFHTVPRHLIEVPNK